MSIFFVLFVRFYSCGVSQNDGMLSPFHQSVGLLLEDYNGYTADECIYMSSQ